MAENYPYENQFLTDPQYLMTITILQSIVAFIFLILFAIIVSKYVKTRVNEVIHLAMTFLFMGLSFLMASIPMYFVFTNNQYNPLIHGLPFSSQRYFWWTNLSYMFSSISIVFLFLFMNSLFKNFNVKVSHIFYLLIIIFNILNTYQGLIKSEEGSLPMGRYR